MEDEIEVAPSEDNGNVPAETPSEQPIETATPAEPTEPVQPTEPELFELPDGRKVDAATLYEEHTKNLLPEFTRRSQELAELKKGTLPNNNEPANKYEDPAYVPTSYEEILKVGEERALRAFEAKEQARIDQQQAIENQVATQLSEIKKDDPTVNENSLFLHANKYGFQDLKLAHQNMKDMSAMAKNVQQTTVANIAKRNDPVSVKPGATGAKPDPSQFENARDYLRSLPK